MVEYMQLKTWGVQWDYLHFPYFISKKGIASQLEEMHNSALLGIFCFLWCLYSAASPQAAVGFFPSSVVLFLYWNENLGFVASLAWVLYCKDSTAVLMQNWCFSSPLCYVWEQMVPWQPCSLAVSTVWLSRAGLLMWGGRMLSFLSS